MPLAVRTEKSGSIPDRRINAHPTQGKAMRKRTRKPRSQRASSKPGHREVKLSGVRTMVLRVRNEDGEIETIAITVPADLTSTRVVVSYTEGVEVRFGNN